MDATNLRANTGPDTILDVLYCFIDHYSFPPLALNGLSTLKGLIPQPLEI